MKLGKSIGFLVLFASVSLCIHSAKAMTYKIDSCNYNGSIDRHQWAEVDSWGGGVTYVLKGLAEIKSSGDRTTVSASYDYLGFKTYDSDRITRFGHELEISVPTRLIRTTPQGANADVIETSTNIIFGTSTTKKGFKFDRQNFTIEIYNGPNRMWCYLRY